MEMGHQTRKKKGPLGSRVALNKAGAAFLGSGAVTNELRWSIEWAALGGGSPWCRATLLVVAALTLLLVVAGRKVEKER